VAHSAKAVLSVPPKVLCILQVVGAGGAHPIPDIAVGSGLPRAVVDRWTPRLVGWRLLELTESGCYRAGLALRLTVGGALPAAAGFLPELAAVGRGRVRLGVLHRSGLGYLERMMSSAAITAAGSRRADTSALGLALLAFGADHGNSSVVSGHPPAGHRSSEKLHHALALTRLSGAAITRRSRGKGFRVAVPVLGSAGIALVAIESTVPNLGDAFPPALAALRAASGRLAQDPALQDRGADDPAAAGGEG